MKIKNIIHRIIPVAMLMVILLSAATNPVRAQKIKLQLPPIEWNSGWAAAFKIGTLGPGLEAIKSVNQNWNARVGFSLLPLPINRTIALENLHLDLNSTLRLGGINLQADFYYHPWYYFTGGLMVNLTRYKLNVGLDDVIQFGDIDISPEAIGRMEIKVRQGWPVSPFLGIGVGNPLPVNRRFWFNVELGAMYGGKPHFSIDAAGMIEPTANAENEKALKEHFKGFRFYPMLSAQVNYLIR